MFDHEKPGVVTMRQGMGDEDKQVQILKDPSFKFSDVRPPPMEPAGMSDARRQYLSRSVRPYIRTSSYDYFSLQHE